MPLAEFSKTENDPRRLRLVRSEGAAGPDEDRFGRLRVAEPRPPAPWLLSGLLVLTVAIGLFLMLNGRRAHRAVPAISASPVAVRSPETAIPDLPADLGLAEPPKPPPPPKPAPNAPPRLAAPPPMPAPILPPQPMRANTATPALVVDFGPQNGTIANGLARTPSGISSGGAAGSASAGGASGATGLEALALGGASADGDRVTATRFSNPSTVVPRGAVIPAVLETAIDSDLPGYSRAVVSRDVLSFDGTTVLIPRGSRLIGQYKSDLVPGQSRVFIVWTSVIRPDGASIELTSPGTDELGRGGLEGEVDRRFVERYGGSALLTTLNAGLNAISAARSQIMIAGGGIATGAAAGAGGKPIGPVVKVRQGARIRVFVARELDFSSVGGAPLKAQARNP